MNADYLDERSLGRTLAGKDERWEGRTLSQWKDERSLFGRTLNMKPNAQQFGRSTIWTNAPLFGRTLHYLDERSLGRTLAGKDERWEGRTLSEWKDERSLFGRTLNMKPNAQQFGRSTIWTNAPLFGRTLTGTNARGEGRTLGRTNAQ
ncbi:hypothetical protein LR48_Vigan03g080500 [Vigna angularis]|uniref:Uncharacterized protein n=1 Tax=Phaseolus angularis TaxID=3914 RepID=A0A0L9U3M4_PHAAN|nr:hypothetical protein LR48_Vigan03g080500 [Vigna angularis]